MKERRRCTFVNAVSPPGPNTGGGSGAPGFMKRVRHALKTGGLALLIALLWINVSFGLTTESVFTTQTPVLTDQADGKSYELGMKFQSAVDGTISAIRYYKAASEPLTGHVGRLWDSNGTLLATTTFSGESGSGWQQQALATPLPVQAGKTYVVSVNTFSHYADTVGGLASPVVNGDLSAVADGTNGVFGDLGTFPNQSYNNSNYFRDVVFEPASLIPNACISGEKYVSVNGPDGLFVRNSITSSNPDLSASNPLVATVPGMSNIPSSTVNIPTAFFGGTKVFYQVVIKNCGNVNLYNVRFDDCADQRSVGANGFLQGGAAGLCVENPRLVPGDPDRIIANMLKPGETVTVTSASFPLDPISTIDMCTTFGRNRIDGIVRNDSQVEADADLNGDGTGETFVFFDDLNLVQCKEFTPAPAALGDRVWRDLNQNGIQDCQDTNNNGVVGDAGDTGDECGAGVPGVTVNLVNCQTPSTILGTTITDANGFYLFPDLAPGQYCVQFNLNTAAGLCTSGTPQFTAQNVGDNDAADSDANPAGLTPPVTLVSGETNRTVDAGVLCSECALAVDKKCLVQPAPSEPFVCSDAKPIDSITMIWTGQDGIYIKAWKGNPGGTLLAVKGPLANGDRVAITGMGGSPLDQIWEIFSGFPDPQGTNKIGQSQFHISCSDIDMNGPEDCGKLEGNAKTTDPSLINLWIFDGMAGNGHTLACTPPSLTGQDACSFVAGPAPSCDSLGVKPTTLTFRYTGNDCSASKNSQASDKWFCSGVPGIDPAITIVKDPARITVDPTTGFKVGDLVTVSAIGSDMGAEIQLQVGGQALKVHTSCSQPLAVGDVFGSLELVEFNGQGAGAEVTYLYDVKNNGSTPISVTRVSDDKLGELLGQTSILPAGGTLKLEKSEFISTTTTNTVTVTGNIGTTACSARDVVTVQAVTPPCIDGSTSIDADFNSTAIPAGRTVWMNAIFKVKEGLSDLLKGGKIYFTGSKVKIGQNSYVVPDAEIRLSSSVSQATTTFDGTKWITEVPSGYSGNIFLTGAPIVSDGTFGGTKGVNWSGAFRTDTSGVKLEWKWAAAAYTTFAASDNDVLVKPIDGDKLNPYKNSDHAGTPENYKPYVVGGARGGGGSNWTGSYSGTQGIDRLCPAP